MLISKLNWTLRPETNTAQTVFTPLWIAVHSGNFSLSWGLEMLAENLFYSELNDICFVGIRGLKKLYLANTTTTTYLSKYNGTVT